jgi:hypothetical protein
MEKKVKLDSDIISEVAELLSVLSGDYDRTLGKILDNMDLSDEGFNEVLKIFRNENPDIDLSSLITAREVMIQLYFKFDYTLGQILDLMDISDEYFESVMDRIDLAIPRTPAELTDRDPSWGPKDWTPIRTWKTGL